MREGDPIFEGEVRMEQKIESNKICVGIFNVRIQRRVEYEELPSVLENNTNLNIES